MSDFNEKSAGIEEKAGEDQPRFSFKPNPMVERAYQFFEYVDYKTELEHVGDYVLINKDEDREVTEKKVMNLVTLMNGKKDLIDLSGLTNTRVLFTIVPEAQAGDKKKIIFKDYDGSGISKDNAVFTIRKGVFKDDS